MPRLPVVLLSVLLSAVLHVDWHLARPAHHRLSLDWPYHWVATALVFAGSAWLIARRWPTVRWQLGATVLVAAILLAQVIEPALEVIVYQGRLGYASEPARWAAFGQALAAAIPVYWGALWLCARSTPTRGAS
jgi:hypothetical protein